MTMQFLASVRRNQRQWMVVITIMSIFAFLVDDVRGANRLSGSSTALFFAVLCAAGMSIIGYPRGHTVIYGVFGFAIGGAAALVGTTYAGPKAPVQTSFGSLTDQKLLKLRQNREKVTQFLMTLGTKSGNPRPPIFGQGDTRTPAMTRFSVLRHEADRMGVSVSDEAVTAFLQDVTNKKLVEKTYLASLKEVGISESELFDLIRAELEVQLVQRLLSPSIAGVKLFFNPELRDFQPGRVALATPDQRWDEFRKMYQRQSLTSVSIPVTEFVKPELIQEPNDTDLRAYFDKRKNFHGDERGNPGFLEFPKVQLAYLKVGDLEAYEKEVKTVTDQEIVDYYNAHRENYRIFDIPDSPNSGLPELKGGADALDGAADATSPTNVEAPGPAPSDPPATDAKPSDKPAADKPQEEGSKEPAKDEEKPKDDPKCGDDETVKKADEKKADESEKKDPAPAGEEKPAEEKKDPAPAAEKGEEIAVPAAPVNPDPDKEGLPKVVPPGPMSRFPNPHMMAPVRYRELDADLKLEINEFVLREKALANMSAAADKAFEFMMELGMKLMAVDQKDQKERAKLIAGFADQCKAYAEKNHLEYHETKAMTRTELATSLDERIGDAMESVGSARDARRVFELAFEMNQSGKPRLVPYSPQRADGPVVRYAYWKIADIPAKVPDFDNKETRQLVLDSWKFEKARELAEKRAGELAELIRKSQGDVSAALEGQTINGTKDSPPVTVREIPAFTWLRTAQSVPTMSNMFGSPPIPSNLGGDLGDPGSDFFKLVFNQLSDGEVGVALNPQRTAFHVVKVHDRLGSGADGVVEMQGLQQRFMTERFSADMMPTPYDFLTYQQQQFFDYRWSQNFDKQFGITYNAVDNNSDSE